MKEEDNLGLAIDKEMDVEIDKAMKTMLVSPKDAKELIKVTASDFSISSFFRLLNGNDDYKKFLFLHRFDLFSFGDDFKLPHLHLCDMPKGKKADEESKTLKQLIVSNESYFEFDSDEILQKFFGLNDKEWKSFVEKYRDIITYYNIKELRQIPELKKLVEMENFSYPFMKSVVGDYKELDEKIANDGDEEIDSVIIEMIRSLFVQFVRSIISNIEGILTKSKEIGSFLFAPFHLSARIWIDNLLDITELEFLDYLNLLDDLHRNDIIDARSILSWCENCSLENQLLTQTIGKIAPSKISRDKCLNCQKYKSYAAIFAFTDLFKDIMLSKDGILSVYFGWLLEINKIQYSFGTYSSKREIDFIVNNSILIETKTLRIQRDNVSLYSNFEKTLNQLRKQITELKDEGIKINKCYLLWNQWYDFNLSKISISPKYKEFIKKYKVEVIGPSGIEDLVNQLIE